MLTDDDYELLVRLEAGELSSEEVAAVEARLALEPAFREAQQHVRSLDVLSKQLPISTDRKVDGLVHAAVRAQRFRSRVWFALAAAVALLVGAGLLGSPPRTTLEVLSDTAVVNGRTMFAGERLDDPRHLMTSELGTAVVRSPLKERLSIAPRTELKLEEGTLELVRGAVVAQGEHLRARVGMTSFVISGSAILSTELLQDAFRVKPDPTQEDLVKLRHIGLAAVVSGAVALYVLQGEVHVESATERATVSGPGQWFSAGSAFVGGSRAPPKVSVSSDAGLEALPAQDGALEVSVTAGGQAVGKAEVTLHPRGAWDPTTAKQTWRDPLPGLTNDAGIATIPASPGSYVVVVRASGWPATFSDVARPNGQPLTRLDVRLERGSSLSGVTESATSHKPVTPATVVAVPRGAPAAEARAVETDELGRFSFADLPKGEWELEGQAPGAGTAKTVVTLPLAQVMKLVFHATGFVDGFVQYPDGGAANGARVFIAGEHTIVTETSPSGSFSVEVPPGVLNVQARLGSLVGAASHELIVHSAETTSAGLITLGVAGSLSGRVVGGDAGIPGALVRVSSHSGTGEIARTNTDENGRYSIPLVGGLYDVAAEAEGFAPKHVAVHASGETHLDLALPMNGRIRGTVVDENDAGVGGLAVELLQNWSARPNSATTTSDGRFEFPSVAPGVWSVSTRRPGAALGVWALTKVEPGREGELQLVLQPVARIVGSAVWKCGGEPQDLELYVYSTVRRHSAVPGWLRLAAGGQVSAALEPDVYSISAHSEGSRCTGSVEVRAEAGKTSTFVVEVTPRHPLEVTVREPDGHPSVHAAITFVDPENPTNILAVGETNEEGVCVDYAPDRNVVVVASNGGRAARSPVSTGAHTVEVKLAESASLDIDLEGMTQGTEATVTLVAPLTASFHDTVISTTPALSVAVPAGRVTITATNGGRQGSADITTKPNEHAHVTLHFQEPGIVRGRLMTLAGQPKSGWVGLLTPRGEERAEAIAVDERGNFELRALPGAYLLSAMGENAMMPVTVKAGEITNVGDFRVAPRPARGP